MNSPSFHAVCNLFSDGFNPTPICCVGHRAGKGFVLKTPMKSVCFPALSRRELGWLEIINLLFLQSYPYETHPDEPLWVLCVCPSQISAVVPMSWKAIARCVLGTDPGPLLVLLLTELRTQSGIQGCSLHSFSSYQGQDTSLQVQQRLGSSRHTDPIPPAAHPELLGGKKSHSAPLRVCKWLLSRHGLGILFTFNASNLSASSRAKTPSSPSSASLPVPAGTLCSPVPAVTSHCNPGTPLYLW